MRKNIKINKLIRNIKNQNKNLNLKNKKINKREIYNNLQSNELITYEEFKTYLNNENTLFNEYNKNRILIEINSAVTIMKDRHKYYKSPETNIQFVTLGNNQDIIIKNRFNEMLYYFTGQMNSEIILIMIKYNLSDIQIFEFIKKNFKYGDDSKYIYKISTIADKIYKYTKHIDKPKILDVGVGSGKKIKKIRELIGKCEIYGADIESWGPYKKKRTYDFPFKTISFNPYKIHYDNNMFDCITLILTLHHTNIVETINECKRILKKDGIIVIVEHDIWNDYDNMNIDLQHRIYEVINNEEPGKRGIYYNFFEWDIIFNKCNMKPIYSDKLFDDASANRRYDLQFIGIYRNL